MVKRQLIEEEKKLTEKNLGKHKATLVVLKNAEEISKFQIDKSMPFSYEQEMENEKLKHKRILSKIEETEVIIKITEDQLINGIEEFEKEEEEDETAESVLGTDEEIKAHENYIKSEEKLKEEEEENGDN